MNAKVTVTMKGVRDQEFTFTDPTVCTVGRADDCLIRVPQNIWFGNVSRHHCRLNIDPPLVAVRDLGSLNGTFVNGRCIGQRQLAVPGKGLVDAATPPWPLHDGDEIKVGDVTLQMNIEQVADEQLDYAHDESDAMLAAY